MQVSTWWKRQANILNIKKEPFVLFLTFHLCINCHAIYSWKWRTKSNVFFTYLNYWWKDFDGFWCWSAFGLNTERYFWASLIQERPCQGRIFSDFREKLGPAYFIFFQLLFKNWRHLAENGSSIAPLKSVVLN